MQCFEAYKTIGVTICVVPIYIGNNEHQGLVMKFMDTIGKRIVLISQLNNYNDHKKNYISFNGQWDAIINQLYDGVIHK